MCQVLSPQSNVAECFYYVRTGGTDSAANLLAEMQTRVPSRAGIIDY